MGLIQKSTLRESTRTLKECILHFKMIALKQWKKWRLPNKEITLSQDILYSQNNSYMNNYPPFLITFKQNNVVLAHCPFGIDLITQC